MSFPKEDILALEKLFGYQNILRRKYNLHAGGILKKRGREDSKKTSKRARFKSSHTNDESNNKYISQHGANKMHTEECGQVKFLKQKVQDKNGITKKVAYLNFNIFLYSILNILQPQQFEIGQLWTCYGTCNNKDNAKKYACLSDSDCDDSFCSMDRSRKKYLHFDLDLRKYCCKDTPTRAEDGLNFIETIILPGLNDMEPDRKETHSVFNRYFKVFRNTEEDILWYKDYRDKKVIQNNYNDRKAKLLEIKHLHSKKIKDMHGAIERHNKLDSTYIKLKKQLYGEIGRYSRYIRDPSFTIHDLKHLKKLLNKEIRYYTFTHKILEIKNALNSLRR